jgi:D-sedoheptulose 7-phosphate isomerase
MQTLSTKDIVAGHLQRLESVLRQVDLDAMERAVELLRVARDSGATVYVAGNGGSAATATHMANDLGKTTKRSGRPPLRVMSLSDGISWLTALANDEGYERVFAGQLENFARLGDVLVVISASGNSPNLVKAVELAQKRGVTTVGMLGFDGGVLKEMVDECVWVPTEIGEYELAEDVHAALCHTFTICLTRDLPAERGLGRE